jgi:ribonuclease HI
VYLNGSKNGDKFGAAGIIILNSKLAHQLKFKLHGNRSNNQAEQTAILKTSEILEKLQNRQDNDKRAQCTLTAR